MHSPSKIGTAILGMGIVLMLPLLVLPARADDPGTTVLNGIKDTTHTAVVNLTITGSGSCTGTFISQRYILTAGHCAPDCPGSSPLGACCDLATWECRSGLVAGQARDGVTPGTGNSWQFDVMLFPTAPANCKTNGNCPPDVALLHTTTDFGRAPMPLMGPTAMPTGSNIASYAGRAATAVGFSNNSGTTTAMRRQGPTKIVGIDLVPANRAFQVDGAATRVVTCPGDSGGPLLVTNSYGTEEVGGVLSQGPNCAAPADYKADYAYVTRSFVDAALCGDTGGWQFLGEHPDNAGAASSADLLRISTGGMVCGIPLGLATNSVLIRNGGEILRWDGNSWWLIDDNPAAAEVAVTTLDVFQRHANGVVWRWDGGFRLWHQVDTSIDSAKRLAGSPARVYQIRGDGRIYRCATTGCDTDASWEVLDDNPTSTTITAGGAFGGSGLLVQMHGNDADRQLWKHATGFRDWQLIDADPATVQAAVGSSQIYQLQSSGRIEQYETIDGGWIPLDVNPASAAIVARGDDLFQMHANGNVWRYQGCYLCWLGLGGAALGDVRTFGSEALRGANPVFCQDVDHDGYGSPASSTCTYASLDCDDTNANVNPGRTEIPGNGIDDDCNAATPGGCQPALAEAAEPGATGGARSKDVGFWVAVAVIALLLARRHHHRSHMR